MIETAYAIVNEFVNDQNSIKHMLAVRAAMRAYAVKFSEDPDYGEATFVRLQTPSLSIGHLACEQAAVWPSLVRATWRRIPAGDIVRL